jgi:uncharacterized protein (DUF58 family)
MDSKELLKKVRKIEIRTKGLVNSVMGGEYQSAFKGRGMEFSEVREYTFGDDVRQIDWNVTARNGSPFIKVFEEEREQTLMLCVDISPSGFFGTQSQSKMDVATEVCAVLAFSAIQNNDKVGLLLFSDHVEAVIPPKKGRSHVLRIIRDVLNAHPTGKGTNIREALHYVNRLLNRRSIVVVASDFQDQGYQKELRMTRGMHDLICLQIEDKAEKELPDMGLLPVKHPETGETQWLDTSSKRVRAEQEASYARAQHDLETMFLKMKLDTIRINTNESYVKPLVSFFQRRIHRG